MTKYIRALTICVPRWNAPGLCLFEFLYRMGPSCGPLSPKRNICVSPKQPIVPRGRGDCLAGPSKTDTAAIESKKLRREN